MLTKDLIAAHQALDLVLRDHTKLDPVAVFRIYQNLARTIGPYDAHTKAVDRLVETEREKLNGECGEWTDQKLAELRTKVSAGLADEEIEVAPLAKIPGGGIPWNQIDPRVGFTLVRLDLADPP